MYLISVYFDEKTYKTLQKLIERVAKASGNMFMMEHQVPPHMTIGAFETNQLEDAISVFHQFQKKFTSGKIRIMSMGQLLPYVLYVTPVLNEYLQGLAEDVNEILEQVPNIRKSKYYRPYSWLPHITIGKTLAKEEMVKAFETMQQYFVPMEATVMEIGLARTNPHEDLIRFGESKLEETYE